MASVISTTTAPATYGDPLKAMSIKALEARQKDLLAQQAAQQPDAAMMATIPGGIGHVLGQVGDSMRTMRTDAAAAEGRNELAATIAQGPKGPDGTWAPEQLSVMARRAPDLMEKFYQQQHERGNLNITESGLKGRNEATIAGQAATNAATNETALKTNAATVEATKRGQDITERIGTAANQNALDLADYNARARREEAIAERTFKAAEARLAEAASRNQTELVGQLTKERDEAKQVFEEKQQNSRQAHETKESGLNRENELEKIDRKAQNEQTAARANEIFEFEKQRREIEGKNSKTSMSDLKDRLGIEKDYIQVSTALNRLGEAQTILTKEGGIDWGLMANLRSGAAVSSEGYTGDKALAERTIRFNSLMSDAAIAQMAARLKGQTTNFEMQKFIDIVNNPSAKPEDRLRAINGLVSGLNAEKMATTRVMRVYNSDPAPLDAELAAGRGKPGEIVQPNISGPSGAPPPATAGGGAGAVVPPPAAGGGAGAAVPPPPAAGGGGGPSPEKIAAAKAWLADPANKADPDYANVLRAVGGR